MSDATQSDHGVYSTGRGAPSGPELVLVLAWSAAEPGRVGEILRLAAQCSTVVGRGEAELAPGERRGALFRERPGAVVAMPALAGASLSRRQATLRLGRGGLEVSNRGRGTLRINGRALDAGTLRAGDTLALADQILFLVCERPLIPFRGDVEPPSFPFGAADAQGMVGEGPVAWALRAELATYASIPGHVLLLGPTGAGKELSARALHACSPRAQRPFVARNAATLPEGLVDAELFGNARGYPHVGLPERPGLFGEANGGTLFLDEIGELPHAVSAHLLRVLDGGEMQRLGESTTRRVDVRVVGATNRARDELKPDVAHRFVHEVRVPSLASRREDLPLLVQHLFRAGVERQPALRRFVDDAGFVRTSPRFVEALLRQPLPGNTREVASLVWRAAATSQDSFLDLTTAVRDALLEVEVSAPAEEPTVEAVRDALARNGGNVTRAAAALGLKNRNALYRLMDRLGIKS